MIPVKAYAAHDALDEFGQGKINPIDPIDRQGIGPPRRYPMTREVGNDRNSISTELPDQAFHFGHIVKSSLARVDAGPARQHGSKVVDQLFPRPIAIALQGAGSMVRHNRHGREHPEHEASRLPFACRAEASASSPEPDRARKHAEGCRSQGACRPTVADR